MSARVAGWILLLTPPLLACITTAREAAVEGVVRDAAGPVAGAHVRWQAQREHVSTDRRGRFRLARPVGATPLVVSKPGYLIASAAPDHDAVAFQLTNIPADNDEYVWVDPHPAAAAVNNCGNCHAPAYREWAGSAHARSARNPKFLSLFGGGSPPHQDWSVRKEHPLGAGVCAACHAPTLSSPSLDYDVRQASGPAADGVHCDYCHKIADAPTDRIGTRFGRDGLRLVRPAAEQQLSFGPLEDAIRPGESFAALPLYGESRYCASCHEGVIFGVHAYGTFSEWQNSPARRRGQQCQDCHMAATGTLTNVAPGHGGIRRDPHTLSSHAFPGSDVAMLRRCLDLQISTRAGERGLQVAVTVRADGVGHRMPTGFPDRHLVLVVEANDRLGRGVALRDGPRLPAALAPSGAEAGWLYGKRFEGADGRTPIPFWLPVAHTTDTRLYPEVEDRRVFVFGREATEVRARLWYRRFWPEVALARGWQDNEVLVHERAVR